MKAVVDRDVFLKLLQKVVPVSIMKTTLPVLGYVKLEVSGEDLKVSATSLELEMASGVTADVSEDGVVLVHGKKLLNLVHSLPPGNLELYTDEKGNFHIEGESGKWRIGHYANLDDFPVFGEVPADAPELIASNSEWWAAVDKVTYAASKPTMARFNLQTVNIHKVAGKIRLVATDGHRLAMVDIDMIFPAGDLRALVAADVLDNVRSAFRGEQGDIEIKVTEKRISFKVGDLFACALLIDGDYPNYQSILPTEPGIRIPVKKDQLVSAVKRATIFSPEKVSIVLEAGLGASVRSAQVDEGDAFDELEVGPVVVDCDVMLNPVYLLDAVGSVDGDEFEFDLGNADVAPIRLYPAANSGQLAIIMPMRK